MKEVCAVGSLVAGRAKVHFLGFVKLDGVGACLDADDSVAVVAPPDALLCDELPATN